jgi:hypothetical protein
MSKGVIMGKGKPRLTKSEIAQGTEVAIAAGLKEGRCKVVLDYDHGRIDIVPATLVGSAVESVPDQASDVNNWIRKNAN